MAIYQVYNVSAKPGSVESALIITNGQRKARVVFAERFGGELDNLIADRVNVNDAGEDGATVFATWDNELPAASESEPTRFNAAADELADWERELLDTPADDELTA